MASHKAITITAPQRKAVYALVAAALAVVARKERLLSAVMGTSRCVVAMTGLFCL